MAESKHKRKAGFRKRFLEQNKQAHEGGVKTFGGNPPPTNSWTCPECGSLNVRDTCKGCGGKKPEDPTAEQPTKS